MANKTSSSSFSSTSRLIDTWHGRITRLPNGLPIEVDPRDLISSHILTYGVWEKETTSFMSTLLKEGMTAIDVGANIGHHSLIASVCVGTQGQVHAFEPHPEVFAIFDRNIKRAACANVVANQLALGANTEQRLLFLHPFNNLGATSFVPVIPGSNNSVPVSVIKLDDYVAAKAIEQVDFLKIDVEGAELGVLEGAAQTLGANREIILLIEFYAANVARFGYSLHDLEAKLRSMGFSLFTLSNRGLMPYRHTQNFSRNVVAVRQLSYLLQALAE